MSITKQALEDALDYYMPHWKVGKLFTPTAMLHARSQAFMRGDTPTSNPHAQVLYVATTELDTVGYITYEPITYEKG